LDLSEINALRASMKSGAGGGDAGPFDGTRHREMRVDSARVQGAGNQCALRAHRLTQNGGVWGRESRGLCALAGARTAEKQRRSEPERGRWWPNMHQEKGWAVSAKSLIGEFSAMHDHISLLALRVKIVVLRRIGACSLRLEINRFAASGRAFRVWLPGARVC
jgi:hypothetical protein